MPKTSVESEIFRKGSTTYYWSSRFFPKQVREDVFKLYSFVRVADDLVDATPQDVEGFSELQQLWRSKDYSSSDNDLFIRVVKNMHQVADSYNFDPSWVDAFLQSMQMDLDQRLYNTLDDTLEYIYGSAEVIGLMMACILGLPKESFETAKLQGRAMQWINFLRDVAEDIELGRRYIPNEHLVQFGLNKLTRSGAQAQPKEFQQLMAHELELYMEWQTAASKGFSYIPSRLLAPLKTAVDMYNWTALEIKENPSIVFEKKVKPLPSQVMLAALRNLISRKA